MNHESIQLANATKHMCEVLWENLQEEMTFAKAIRLTECEPKYGRAVWDVLYHIYKKIRPTGGRGMGSLVKMTMPVAPSDIVDKVGMQAGCIMMVINGAKDYLLQVSDEDAEVMKREGYDEEDHDLDDNFQPKVIDAPEPEPEQEEKDAPLEGISYGQIEGTIEAVLNRAFEKDGYFEEKAHLALHLVRCIPIDHLLESLKSDNVLALIPEGVLYKELRKRGYEGAMTKTEIKTLS